MLGEGLQGRGLKVTITFPVLPAQSGPQQV